MITEWDVFQQAKIVLVNDPNWNVDGWEANGSHAAYQTLERAQAHIGIRGIYQESRTEELYAALEPATANFPTEPESTPDWF